MAFLFTDIEGSTRLLDRLGDSYAGVLAAHRDLLRAAFAHWHGYEVDTQGDSFFVVFTRISDALSCALEAHLALAAREWPGGVGVQVRIGIHAGEAVLEGDGYVGRDVHKAARIAAAGHGGQVVLSHAAAELARGHLPAGADIDDLGLHELKDLPDPERIFQLVHPDLRREFPPLNTRRAPGHVPAEASTFVGRNEELGAIGRTLIADPVRLLTLTGPGGAGKTRLALRTAELQASRFDNGVFFIDLSSATDTDAALALVASGLRLNQAAERPTAELLTHHLQQAVTLLILDNFEQVMSAAPVMAQLLEACPRLRLLVTSREPLHLRGEQVFPVPPLSLPPESAIGDVREVSQFEAIQLFVARARAINPAFALTDDNAAAVLEICRRVDGLPLAIELAAARLNLFSPEALSSRLVRRLAVLGQGPRNAPDRQRTLRATLEWSYDLLAQPEQRLFAVLSVFSGGRYDDIDAVTSEPELSGLTGTGALDGVASLLDKSLLRNAGDARTPRVRMLETIREYAAERLADDRELEERARLAHATHFAARAADLSIDDASTHELDDLRAAWRYWIGQRDLAQLDRLIDVLWRALDERGLYAATIPLATDMLEVLNVAPESPDVRARRADLMARRMRARLATSGYTGDVEDAITGDLRALEAQQGQSGEQLFPVLRSLASLHQLRMELDKAGMYADRMIELGKVRGDGEMEAVGHLSRASSRTFAGDFPGAAEDYDVAVAWYDAHVPTQRSRSLGVHPAVVAYTTSGLFLWLLGYPDRAIERARRGVELSERLDHPYSVAYASYHAGFLRVWRREPNEARTHALGVLAAIEERDIPIWRALGTCLLGAANVALGATDEGIGQFEVGIHAYAGIRTPPIFWPFLRLLQATTYAQAGRIADAATVLDEAMALVGDQFPQFPLLNGELLMAANGAMEGSPDPWFRRALDMSAAVGARMPQLQAACALRRWGLSIGSSDGLAELQDVYATFSEGFDTPDLRDARDLLGRSPPAMA